MEQATRTSWQTLPPPDERERLAITSPKERSRMP
jgi:hypothetical protein